jgi:uncharacterized protein YdaU (DUF1376 family)
MSGQYFMPLWTDAYLGDTKHLTTVQHGAYLLLLITMWRNGGSLPNDEKRLARTVGLQPDRWRKINKEVLALFEIEGDQITQKRLSLELKKTIDLTQKRATAGGAGGRAKSLKTKGSGVASATDVPEQKGSLQILNPAPAPAPTRKPTIVGVSEGDGFDEFRQIQAEIEASERAESNSKPDKVYAFEAGAIRLTEADFQKWKGAFTSINLQAELLSLERWANELKAGGNDWFYPISQTLAKRNRNAEAEFRKAKVTATEQSRRGIQSGRPAI